MKKWIAILLIIIGTISLLTIFYSFSKNQNFRATCAGGKYCNACKNCDYCKHCSKNGGVCGVCSTKNFESVNKPITPVSKTKRKKALKRK